MKPNTRYAKSGSINVAYQVFGEGDFDLIYIPGWISNIDLMWSCPELVSFLEALGKMCRVILFDKRGTGLSDRVVELSTLEERMDDIRAVMDAVDSDKAILFGHSEGGSVSALFAATYPNRTIALITFGVFAKRKYSPEYPWAPSDVERQEIYDMIENNWGSGEMNLESLAPSKADDKQFMEWLANYFRSGASPSAALVLTKMNTQVDIIDVLSMINVPTLLMQRTDDVDVKIEEGRFISERIKGSIFKEFEGNDHLFWVGNTEEVISEMLTFISNLKPFVETPKKLLAIVVAEISAPFRNPEKHSLISINAEQVNQQLIQKYRGNLHLMEDNRIIATFEGPSKAIHCCLDFQNVLKAANIIFKAGIHIGECVIDNGKIRDGLSLAKAKSITRHAKANDIFVTQTIKNLLPEGGLKFTLVNSNSTTDILPRLYNVEDMFYEPMLIFNTNQIESVENDQLIDRVLKAIYDNIDNEAFSVETLCNIIRLSERQLQRKLKAITNKSPNQMIRSVRLHKAKEMITKKLYGIAEIAFQTGFSNPSYFSKCFKKEFGISPSEIW